MRIIFFSLRPHINPTKIMRIIDIAYYSHYVFIKFFIRHKSIVIITAKVIIMKIRG